MTEHPGTDPEFMGYVSSDGLHLDPRFYAAVQELTPKQHMRIDQKERVTSSSASWT